MTLYAKVNNYSLQKYLITGIVVGSVKEINKKKGKLLYRRYTESRHHLCETGKYDHRKSIQNHSTYGRLVRLEYNADGEFEDRATQMVLYRDFPEVDYRVIHTENGMRDQYLPPTSCI